MKVPLWKEVMRFRKKEKFSLRYVEPFEILDRVGTMAYRVALPPQLSNVHNVRHTSMLRKHVHDLPHIFEYKLLQIRDGFSHIEYHIRILDWLEQVLLRRIINLVKVLCKIIMSVKSPGRASKLYEGRTILV